MIVAPSPSEIIRKARLEAGLTQEMLAAQSGIRRSKISKLETGVRVPTEQEQFLLNHSLGLPLAKLNFACGPLCAKGFRKASRRKEGSDAPIRRDRPSQVRYLAAQRSYPELMGRLEKGLRQSQDPGVVGRYLRDACFDSALELVASLHLLNAGALPGRASPLFAGYDRLPVVDPKSDRIVGHLNCPCLALFGALWFAQLSLRTRQSGRPRVDLLVVSKAQALVVEFDGSGHGSADDGPRSKALEMPVLRFDETQVLTGSFAARLRERLLKPEPTQGDSAAAASAGWSVTLPASARPL